MRLLETAPYVLAEGPVWDPSARRLSWVDIDDGRVMSAILDADGSLGDVTTGFPWLDGDVGVTRSDGDGRLLTLRLPGIRGLAPTARREAPLPR